MEGTFLDPQFVPVVGSLVAGILLLGMVVAAVVYGWMVAPTVVKLAEAEKKPPEELKKAA